MAKAMFLLFDTNNQARIVKKSIKDGFVDIDGKLFMVDESTPLLVKTFFGFKPLYICKWSNVQPSTNINPIESTEIQIPKTEGTKPEFKGKHTDITPEFLRKLTGLKILGNMIKPKRAMGLGGLPLLIMGLVSGILILYSLIYFKIIPI